MSILNSWMKLAPNDAMKPNSVSDSNATRASSEARQWLIFNFEPSDDEFGLSSTVAAAARRPTTSSSPTLSSSHTVLSGSKRTNGSFPGAASATSSNKRSKTTTPYPNLQDEKSNLDTKPAANPDKDRTEQQDRIAKVRRQFRVEGACPDHTKELEDKNFLLGKELEALKQRLLCEGKKLASVKEQLERKSKKLRKAKALLQDERKEHAKTKDQLADERHELAETTKKLAAVRDAHAKANQELTTERGEKFAALHKTSSLKKRVDELEKCISRCSGLINKVRSDKSDELESQEEKVATGQATTCMSESMASIRSGDMDGMKRSEEENIAAEPTTTRMSGSVASLTSSDTDGLDETWKQHFEQLKSFKATHGGRVNPTEKEDKTLRRWLNKQRHRRMLMKESPNPPMSRLVMTHQEYLLLHELGVDLDRPLPPTPPLSLPMPPSSVMSCPRSKGAQACAGKVQTTRDESKGAQTYTRKVQIACEQWNASYVRLIEFKKRHGHVSPTEKEDSALCYWVRKQRTRHKLMLGHPSKAKDRVMDVDEYEKLCQLGMVFDA